MFNVLAVVCTTLSIITFVAISSEHKIPALIFSTLTALVFTGSTLFIIFEFHERASMINLFQQMVRHYDDLSRMHVRHLSWAMYNIGQRVQLKYGASLYCFFLATSLSGLICVVTFIKNCCGNKKNTGEAGEKMSTVEMVA